MALDAIRPSEGFLAASRSECSAFLLKVIVRPKLDSCLRVVSGADGSELRKALELAVVWTQGQISLLVIGRAGCLGDAGRRSAQ